jgi:hypothetical protein
MEIDSILVRAHGHSDVRRLTRAGGDVWQWEGHVGPSAGRVRWTGALVRMPARAALRMGLISPGPECSTLADPEPDEGTLRASHARGKAGR